jgi:DNA-binding response OmpR family regulator
MSETWRIVVVTSDPAAWRDISENLNRLGFKPTWASNVTQCRRIFRRDTISLVFCDEHVDDGDYWDVYGAITRGLILKPKVILMSRAIDVAEAEQAKCCGIFAVIEFPCRPAAIEWAVILARRSARTEQKAPAAVPKFDIFSGVPDRDAVWICSVRGLANAKERMDAIAAEQPGRYFIFYALDRSILAETETFAAPSQTKRGAQGESA